MSDELPCDETDRHCDFPGELDSNLTQAPVICAGDENGAFGRRNDKDQLLVEFQYQVQTTTNSKETLPLLAIGQRLSDILITSLFEVCGGGTTQRSLQVERLSGLTAAPTDVVLPDGGA